VAGEWILRCGGGVKFTRIDRYIWDYNALPEWSRNKYEVEGIDAKNTYITDGGLDHLGRFTNGQVIDTYYVPKMSLTHHVMSYEISKLHIKYN
jgi:hypothetical protein